MNSIKLELQDMLKLLIKVKPNSSADEIFIDAENNLTVKIKAKPVDGKANDYLVKYLAKELNISRSLIQIEKGQTSRLKRIVLKMDPTEFEAILNFFYYGHQNHRLWRW